MVFSPDGSRLYVAHDGRKRQAEHHRHDQSNGRRNRRGTTPDNEKTWRSVLTVALLYFADGYYNRIQVDRHQHHRGSPHTSRWVRALTTATRAASPSVPTVSGRTSPTPENAAVSVIDLTTRRVVGGDPIVVASPPVVGQYHSADCHRRKSGRQPCLRWQRLKTSWLSTQRRGPSWVPSGSPVNMSDTSARASQAIAVDSDGDILAYGGSGLVSLSIGASSRQGLLLHTLVSLASAP